MQHTFLGHLRDDTPRGTEPSISCSSQRLLKSAASVHDTDFRDSLRYRNVYIEREDPPTELIQRSREITMRPRSSPEIDQNAAQIYRNKSRRLQTEAERVIIEQLAPHVIPGLDGVTDRVLAQNSDQLWYNSVPLPIDPAVLTTPIPLQIPKPDKAFGYSEEAFTKDQLTAIDLLTDQSGRSYAVPDKRLRFPFLHIEFKSQAKKGTHYVATNQVAVAGSIMLNSHLELTRRGLGIKDLDYNEPLFYSLSMDHQVAYLNVHWLGTDAKDGQISFHVEGLSKHFLDEIDGLRAVQKAVKNILDYGQGERLKSLCKALDAYRQRIQVEREMAVSEGRMAYERRSPSQKGYQRPRDRRLQSPLTQQQQTRSRPDSPIEKETALAGEGPMDQLQTEQQGRRATHRPVNSTKAKKRTTTNPATKEPR